MRARKYNQKILRSELGLTKRDIELKCGKSKSVESPPKECFGRFQTGRKYVIFEGRREPVYEDEVALVYEGKQGKHYVFRSVLGGWLTTYTEVQLMDKTVKRVEVNDHV